MSERYTGCRPALAAMLSVMLASCGARSADPGAASAADREAVEAALSRYTHGLDRLDADLYVSSFAPDGVLVITGTPHQGHEALRAIIAGEAKLRRESTRPGEAGRTLFHLESNSRIWFPAPDRAEHEAYWITASRTADTPEGTQIIGVGTSTDELRRIDGHWLITRREISMQP